MIHRLCAGLNGFDGVAAKPQAKAVFRTAELAVGCHPASATLLKGKAMIVKKVNLAQCQFTKVVVYEPVPANANVTPADKK